MIINLKFNLPPKNKFEMKRSVDKSMQSMPNLNPQQQQELMRFQQIQQSLEVLMQQKATLEARLKETEMAVTELEKISEDNEVYQAVGGLMIKKSRNELLESSKDRQETLQLRVKSLGEQEVRLKKQYEEQKTKVQLLLKNSAQ